MALPDPAEELSTLEDYEKGKAILNVIIMGLVTDAIVIGSYFIM